MQRSVVTFGLLASAAAAAAASPAATKRVAGKVVLASSICSGGVAVTREDIERLPPAQPLAGKELLVVAGEQIRPTRPAAHFTTGGDGTFVIRLPRGKWCFFDAARKLADDRASPVRMAAPAGPGIPGIDADCLEAEKHRCDVVLDVKSDVGSVVITFAQRCPEAWAQPCYRGPMPP